MDLYPQIFTRKSVRKFESTPPDAETIKDLRTFINGVKPLLPDSKLTYKIVGPDEVKGMALPKAPCFLLISGSEQPLRNTCAGFLFQHAELYLYSKGYATRWLAGAKSKQDDPNSIIGLAFGKPTETASRKHEEFDRKPMSEIARGSDPRLEAARLAPSGMNSQPWYFIVDGSAVHVYYKKSLGGLIGRMYHHTDFDAGIALCHLDVASEHEGRSFSFTVDGKPGGTAPKGFDYVGMVY